MEYFVLFEGGTFLIMKNTSLEERADLSEAV